MTDAAASEGEPSLVERAQRREPNAWEALYRSAYPRLFFYARGRLVHEADAEDAVSETMARALQRIDVFRFEGIAIEGWLFGILRNVIFETHRKRLRGPGRPVELDAGSPDPDSQDPLDEILANEQAQVVHQAFRLLSPAEQEILELRFLGGLTSDEVARVVGKRPSAVRMAQGRALTRLRRLLTVAEAAEARRRRSKGSATGLTALDAGAQASVHQLGNEARRDDRSGSRLLGGEETDRVTGLQP